MGKVKLPCSSLMMEDFGHHDESCCCNVWGIGALTISFLIDSEHSSFDFWNFKIEGQMELDGPLCVQCMYNFTMPTKRMFPVGLAVITMVSCE
jgi:hypothetical protein